MMAGERKFLVVGALVGCLGSTANAVDVEPIISACAPRYAVSVVLGKLKQANWLPIAEDEFQAFAPMLADSYLHEPYESPFSPLKPDDSRVVLIEKLIGLSREYQDPQQGWKILKNADDPAAFLVVRGIDPNGGNTSPSSCVLYADEGSYSSQEVEDLVGHSPKHLTSLGYRQVALVRNENGSPLYKLEAKFADDPGTGARPIERPRATLILTVETFKSE